jgi:hypothetical protein
MAPVYLLFGPQENWEEVKMTFMLLAWPPIGVFAAAGGLPWLDPSSRRRAIQTTVGLAVLVMVGVKLLGTVHAPQDERWYIRFPKAAETDPGAQPGLAEAQRNDWTYFQSYETEEEIARERHKLTRALPWPARYLPLEWDFSREWGEMVQESGTRELRILEIWGYIYDQDKRFVEEQAN